MKIELDEDTNLYLHLDNNNDQIYNRRYDEEENSNRVNKGDYGESRISRMLDFEKTSKRIQSKIELAKELLSKTLTTKLLFILDIYFKNSTGICIQMIE